MDDFTLLPVGAVIVLLHILINAHLSKEIYQWEPSLPKRVTLLICVWFLPIIGVAIAYKSLDLSWFKHKNKNAASGQSTMGGAFLEVDAIFNPGQKHVMEAKQKETIEKKENGEMYKKGEQDLNTLKSTNASDK